MNYEASKMMLETNNLASENNVNIFLSVNNNVAYEQ